MTELRLGDYNVLRMKEPARREGYGEVFGIYLDGGREGDILMPQKYVPEGVRPGDEVRCFLYLDQEERPIATTEKPLAKVGDFAWLECTWVNEFGAFLDWGLTKNLFCPFREQKMRMEKGKRYIVYVYIDDESYRIVASAKVDRFLEEPWGLEPGQPVDLLVWQKTDLGFKVIIDNRCGGLVYDNQVFRPLHTGDRVKGYVGLVRDDGKVDVTLQPTGRQETLSFADELLQWLRDNGGHCGLGDKSDPEDIKRAFHVSKKVFKKAIGDLYRRRLIRLEGSGFTLAEGGQR